MEENNSQEVKTEKIASGEAISNNPQGSYITGTIGAIIGGAIASLPWVLVYVYGNMIVAILAVLIALGAFYGYKIAKGKMGKGLPAIIAIVSVGIIVLLTTIICPLVILADLGVEPSFETIQRVYEDEKMASAIMQDALVSIAFTIIGIAGTIKSMRMQIKAGSKDIKFSEQPLSDDYKKYVKEQAEETKKAFDSLGALNSENTAEKKEIINELVMTHNVIERKAKANFQLLYNNGIIKKVKGKYYYDVENEEANVNGARQNNPATNRKNSIITLAIVFVVFFVVIMIGVIAYNASIEKVTIPNTEISVNAPSDLYIYDTKEKITKKFGSDYADYYCFAVLDKDNKVEVYASTISKKEIDPSYDTLDKVAAKDKTYADANYDDVTEVLTKKIGKTEFKYYTYTYGEETRYIGNLYVADAGDVYLFIDCYADLGDQSEIDSAMKTLFK